MPWPVPLPSVISARAAAVYSGIFPDFNPNFPNTVAGTNCDIVAMSAYDLYSYQGYIAQELFPDTTQDNLDHHASIWGLTRIPAMAATGTVSVAGTNGTVLASGIVATDTFGNAYMTTNGATIASGTATLNITAATAGAKGNLAAGTVLQLLSPVSGLSPQTMTILAPGLTGGAPAESDTSLRARLLARIRARGRGGNISDYTQWAEASSSAVAYVQVFRNWVGLGSVGVWVAGIGPAALSDGEVATVDAYIQGVRPVTARVLVMSAAVQTVNGTVHLIPDTTANRTAAVNGFEQWVATTAEIGGTEYLDGMAAAIQAAGAGAFDFDIVEPAADVVLGAGTIAVAGTLSFV